MSQYFKETEIISSILSNRNAMKLNQSQEAAPKMHKYVEAKLYVIKQ